MNKIQHSYKSEILIPVGAVDGNIELMLTKKGLHQTSDYVLVESILMDTIHALSKEGELKIKQLYGMSRDKFLNEWYDRLGWSFNSLELLNIKLIKND